VFVAYLHSFTNRKVVMPGTWHKQTVKEIWSFDEDEKEFLVDPSNFYLI